MLLVNQVLSSQLGYGFLKTRISTTIIQLVIATATTTVHAVVIVIGQCYRRIQPQLMKHSIVLLGMNLFDTKNTTQNFVDFLSQIFIKKKLKNI